MCESTFAEKTNLIEVAADVVRIRQLELLLKQEEISGSDFVAVIDLISSRKHLTFILIQAQCIKKCSSFKEAKKIVKRFFKAADETDLPSHACRKEVVRTVLGEYRELALEHCQEFQEAFGYNPDVSNVEIQGLNRL